MYVTAQNHSGVTLKNAIHPPPPLNWKVLKKMFQSMAKIQISCFSLGIRIPLFNTYLWYLGNLPHSIWGYTTTILDPSVDLHHSKYLQSNVIIMLHGSRWLSDYCTYIGVCGCVEQQTSNGLQLLTRQTADQNRWYGALCSEKHIDMYMYTVHTCSVHVQFIYMYVQYTSEIPYSGHPEMCVHFPICIHYNPRNQDTSLKPSDLMVSTLERFHCMACWLPSFVHDIFSILGSFAAHTSAAALHEMSILTAEKNKIHIRTFQVPHTYIHVHVSHTYIHVYTCSTHLHACTCSDFISTFLVF